MRSGVPLRVLLDNLGSAFLALLLAFMVWVVAITEGNPVREGPYPEEGLPLEAVNLPQGLVLFEPITERVSVILRAPQNIWEQLDPGNFRAFVDLSGLDAGIHEVPVQIKCAVCDQRRITMLGTSPDKITVRLDEVMERQMQVAVEVLDNPALGYTYRLPEVTPRQVLVTGPRSQVEQVVKVTARLFLLGSKVDVERQVSVLPQDNQGHTVAKVEVVPATVAVRVPIVERRGYKEVSVKVVTVGSPYPGYYISNITAEPSTLTVFGQPVLLEEAPGVIETEPVDVTDAKATVEKRVGLVVPEGLSILNQPQSVLVRVEVSPILAGQTFEVPVRLRGLGAGLQAVPSPETVEVILSGPLPELQELQPGDIQVLLDLADLGRGTFKVAPTVIKPDTLKVESIVPEQVEVVISLASTPTVTPEVEVTTTLEVTVTLELTPTMTPRPGPTPTMKGVP
jgi:YbbR domain-containing protein